MSPTYSAYDENNTLISERHVDEFLADNNNDIIKAQFAAISALLKDLGEFVSKKGKADSDKKSDRSKSLPDSVLL